MNAKERFLATLRREKTDRMPVTTHHIMPSYLDNKLGGASDQDFFDQFSIDPIAWKIAYTCNPERGEYLDPLHTELGFLEARRVASDNWRFHIEPLSGYEYATQRFNIITPDGTLSMILQSNEHTTWVVEHLIKNRSDIEIIAKYAPSPTCDREVINTLADSYGNRGLVRGHICCFDGFGQPGTWQDAACIVGIEPLIMAAFDDPQWVHELLAILQKRKLDYVKTLNGVKYDLLELGGGDASTTVISPAMFDEFVAPYDSEIIAEAHRQGQRISYHTCGGMMPILESLAAMKPDAMETFTPVGMGGDVDLAEAKRRIGDKVCMIGGFDQLHFFTDCTPEACREEVKRCFEAAGGNGGFILAPSDHFFDAEPALLHAFAEEAARCTY